MNDLMQQISQLLAQKGVDLQEAMLYAQLFILTVGGELLAVLLLQQAQLQGMDPAQAIVGVILKASQLAGTAQSARNGAKLNYLRSLKDKCPEGTELQYFKVGGRVCSKCVAKKAACGTKIESKKCGGKKKSMTKAIDGIKVEMAKCGKKTEIAKCGGKTKKK